MLVAVGACGIGAGKGKETKVKSNDISSLFLQVTSTHDDELMIKNHRSDDPSPPHTRVLVPQVKKLPFPPISQQCQHFAFGRRFGQLTKQKEELPITNPATMAPYECNDRNQLSQEIRIKATLLPYPHPSLFRS